ncbi:TetR/AcrR family transcriptional regulator [Streptomyces sp. AN091965]|uniref:TetR/AcrR family transcriptional regulator n=1 Tax=Streptomyces sp. AN091965 TaxID=2927803 RepID=UPI001F60E521|nr:TetR/AcrR family transcriptional regulator [Streptomyces sp. AN091965]MCI3932131.1 TetR/AcrR family transcriptional regulator [Streptomyces sp. AN091965]
MTSPKEGASRRARHRAQTTAEIKATALKHLVEGGTDAVALRGIARDMGMAPGTFYSYFDTREALLAALAADAYRALAAHLHTARDGAREPADRALEHGLAYRAWALAHPQEFRLLFSGRSPHARTPDSTEAEYELCLGIVEIAATARSAGASTGARPRAGSTRARPDAGSTATGQGAESLCSDYSWGDFDPAFTEVARAAFPGLTPATLARSLRLWGRLHGLVTLEIDGLLRPQIADPERLYRDELADVTAWLRGSWRG